MRKAVFPAVSQWRVIPFVRALSYKTKAGAICIYSCRQDEDYTLKMPCGGSKGNSSNDSDYQKNNGNDCKLNNLKIFWFVKSIISLSSLFQRRALYCDDQR